MPDARRDRVFLTDCLCRFIGQGGISMKTVFKHGTADSIADSVAAELRDCTFIVYCADDKRFAEISSKFHMTK